MEGSAVYLQPAFILHHRPLRESSLLLEVFTHDFGIVSILARGVRKEKSKTVGLLLPFSLLRLSYLDKNELKVLTHVETVVNYPLQKMSLYCGFYANELLQKFLHRHDPHPQLFSHYQACLRNLLSGEAIEQSLRYFELGMLEEAGYAVQLHIEHSGNTVVKNRRRYHFMPGSGMIEDSGGCVSGETLLALAAKAPLPGVALVEAKQLLRGMLDEHLQGRPLKSREVLAKMIKYL